MLKVSMVFAEGLMAVLFLTSSLVMAAEHAGAAVPKEHGGAAAATQEQGGQAMMTAPSNDDIRNAMKNYVMETSKATGAFDVADPETGQIRKLELIRVHERVGKTGNYYYSCADFKDTVSGEMLDLDLDVADNNGQLSVVDTRIHKVNGKERYTYDANDNRIPVAAAAEEKEHGGMEHIKEHGGKEHGGQ